MRLAIGRVSDGEIEYAEKICRFVREIHRELTLVFPLMNDSHDMKMKMDTMLQSVIKIENGICLYTFIISFNAFLIRLYVNNFIFILFQQVLLKLMYKYEWFGYIYFSLYFNFRCNKSFSEAHLFVTRYLFNELDPFSTIP